MTNAITRALGSAAPATFDREKRTVEVVACSGFAPAVRPAPAPDGSHEKWIEELDPAGADLSRFIGGPVLKDHKQTTDATVGVIDAATLRGGQLVATVRFGVKPAAAELMEDVAAGVIRGVSLGALVQRWRACGRRDGLPVFRAAAWIPHELSFTPTPVDSGAIVRSASPMEPENFTPCESCATPTGCAKLGGCVQDANGGNKTAATSAATDASPAPAAASTTRALANAEIRSIARVAGLDGGFADRLIDRSASVEEARAEAFAALSRRGGGAVFTAGRIEVGTDHGDPAAIRRAMADALAARLSAGRIKPEGRATAFMSYRALDMVGELAVARGERFNRFDQNALVERAIGGHSSADFPLLLADAGNKLLLTAYQAAAPTYRTFAARRPFNDFKPHKFLRLGDFPAYAAVAEGAGVKYGTISENRETVTAAEYATGFIVGRRALMNDDLGALSDFSSMIAIRTAADENRMVFALLNDAGPALADGKTLFHADHGNVASAGTAINVASIGDARAAMREQTSLDGIKLNIEGKLLVVGSAKEVEAKQLVANVTPAKAADVNPWSGSLDVVVDSNVVGKRWHLFADPAVCPVVVYGYVGGSEGPQILTERDFDTQSIKVRAGLDFACGVIDFRGAYLNAGN